RGTTKITTKTINRAFHRPGIGSLLFCASHVTPLIVQDSVILFPRPLESKEFAKAIDKLPGLLPRNAVARIGTDPQLCVGQSLRCASCSVAVLLVVLTGDPQRRNVDVLQ